MHDLKFLIQQVCLMSMGLKGVGRQKACFVGNLLNWVSFLFQLPPNNLAPAPTPQKTSIKKKALTDTDSDTGNKQ